MTRREPIDKWPMPIFYTQLHYLGISISFNRDFLFAAEMWFGIVFAIVVEIVPLSLRSTTVGVFLFVMNNIGGNLPILVEPTRMVIGFRESLYIYYAGFYGISEYLKINFSPFDEVDSIPVPSPRLCDKDFVRGKKLRAFG